jgi:hypothetical protein
MSARNIAFALFAGALLLHIGFFLQDYSHVMPGDTGEYLESANALLHRGAILDHDGQPQTRRGPGYIPLVAIVLACGGGVASLTLLNHLFAACFAPLTFAIARESCGTSVAAATCAAGIVAIHADILSWSDFVLSEAFFVLLMLIALVLILRGHDAVGAVLLGLAILTRPIAILVPLAVAVFTRRPRRIATIVLIAYLFPTLWIVRNEVETGAAVLSSTANENMLLWRAAGAVTMEEKGFTLSLFPSKREDDYRHHFFFTVQHRLGNLAIDEAQRRYGPHPTHIQIATVSPPIARRIILERPFAFIESTLHSVTHLLGDPIWGAPYVGVIVSIAFALLAIAGSFATPHRIIAAAFWALVIASSGPESAYYSRFRYPTIPLMAILAVEGTLWLNRLLRRTRASIPGSTSSLSPSSP